MDHPLHPTALLAAVASGGFAPLDAEAAREWSWESPLSGTVDGWEYVVAWHAGGLVASVVAPDEGPQACENWELEGGEWEQV